MDPRSTRTSLQSITPSRRHRGDGVFHDGSIKSRGTMGTGFHVGYNVGPMRVPCGSHVGPMSLHSFTTLCIIIAWEDAAPGTLTRPGHMPSGIQLLELQHADDPPHAFPCAMATCCHSTCCTEWFRLFQLTLFD